MVFGRSRSRLVCSIYMCMCVCERACLKAEDAGTEIRIPLCSIWGLNPFWWAELAPMRSVSSPEKHECVLMCFEIQFLPPTLNGPWVWLSRVMLTEQSSRRSSTAHVTHIKRMCHHFSLDSQTPIRGAMTTASLDKSLWALECSPPAVCSDVILLTHGTGRPAALLPLKCL